MDVLYVASSDQNTTRSGRHSLSAFSISAEGVPTSLGVSTSLAARPIHLTVDQTGRYILVAYNNPATVSVHRIAEGGEIGEMVPQQAVLDAGTYPHQIRMMPSNKAVLVPARGNDPRATRAEDPGSLRIFDFEDGQLTKAQTVAPGSGFGFRPRHADFHPGGQWAYVALESENAVQTYPIHNDRLSAEPLYTVSTLPGDQPVDPGQRASAIRVHPNGRHLYVANRGTGTVTLEDGRKVSVGENTIAVFAIGQQSGEPTLIQTINVRGVHARTLDLSANGEWLLAGSIRPALVGEGNEVTTSEAGLTLFHIEREGRLCFANKLDLDTAGDAVFWVGAWR
jgi:6-phosphogluconolactonase (cycloisomerase 2 family)